MEMVAPEILVGALHVLAWAFLLVGGGLISAILYVWAQHKNTTEANFNLFRGEIKELSSSLRDEIGKVAQNLEGITKLIFDRQNELAQKVVEMETRCEERNRNGSHDLFRRRDDWKAE